MYKVEDIELVEHAVLTQLEVDTSTEMVSILMSAFFKDLRARYAVFDEALVERDLLRLAREAHAVKGSAATMGAVALSRLASKIEYHCNSNDSEIALELVYALKPLAEKSIKQLSDIYLERTVTE